jgi:hypothetical protein
MRGARLAELDRLIAAMPDRGRPRGPHDRDARRRRMEQLAARMRAKYQRRGQGRARRAV